jgi:ribosomal small subunit protein bTHX
LIINDGIKRFLYLFFAQFINKIYSLMGKGDKKSRRGKIHIGSAGVRRHRKKVSRKPASPVVKAEVPAKKPKAKAADKPKPAVVEAPEVVEAVAPAPEEAKPAAKKKAPAKTTAKKAKSEDKPAEPAE